MKKDDEGKVQPALVIMDMPRALHAVAQVATFGAKKYEPRGWLGVPNGVARYTDARVARAAGQITARLGLSVSVQDWLVDREGERWFLEANPAGQWLFLDGADQLVTPALADHLAHEHSR